MRKRVAVVFQELGEFWLSVRQNIGYGKLERIDDQPAIEAAATKSGADTFIRGLTHQYRAMLGPIFDGGHDLSVGQWQERNRWRQPNPADTAETWDPDRLDELLELLGTQNRPAEEGRSLTWTSPWNEYRWQTSRRQMADMVTTNDAFGMTRAILAEGADLPKVVEAHHYRRGEPRVLTSTAPRKAL